MRGILKVLTLSLAVAGSASGMTAQAADEIIKSGTTARSATPTEGNQLPADVQDKERPKGFIFRSQDIHHARNPSQSVRLGEKVSPQLLKKRFAGYEVRYTKGEDCLTCAVISGADGQFEISFAQDGRTIIDIRSYDDRSRDAQGNAVGASLVKAIGSTSAECDAGMDTTCASPSLKGLWYIVADDDRCPITAKEKQPTDIPACARIAGLQIQANESTAQPETNPRTGKILLGTHIGDATIVSLAGVDTGQAVVKFERKLDDVVEDCARNIGANEDGTVPSEKVANCVKSGLSEWGKKVLTRRAVCPRSTLYTEFGNYSLIDYVKEEDQKKGDHTWRPVRTNWKNHRDDKIVGNCGGCNTPQLLDTYRILCPSWYKDAFDGRDPY